VVLPALVAKAPRPRSTVALVSEVWPNWSVKFTRTSPMVPDLPPLELKPENGLNVSWQAFPSELMARREVLLQVPPALTCTGM